MKLEKGRKRESEIKTSPDPWMLNLSPSRVRASMYHRDMTISLCG